MISAVMPAHDAARTIEAAIRSVQAQTDPSWELIVVDDGSDDGTGDIAQDLARSDHRVVVHTITHRGRGAARNHALRLARGTFVALCDADDLSRPLRFERQRTALETDTALFAVGAGLAPFADAEVPTLGALGVRRWPSERVAVGRRFSQLRMAVPNCAVMMRSAELERLGGYDEDLQRAQDLDLFLRAHRAGLVFENLDDVLVDYRQRGVVHSFDYYRTNAHHHARVVHKHARGLRALAPYALVHRLGPLAQPPRYALYRIKRRWREGSF